LSLIVQKYGGTSMGSVERIREVARRVARFAREGHQLIVVPSAMAGETNRLLGLANELNPDASPRELDVIASTGEQVSIGLLSVALQKLGLKARSYTGFQVKILTDDAHTKARILVDRGRQHPRDLADGNVVVVAGFQGIDARGNITTLGRGGSDTTGVALAAALKADECQIYTDVDGVYTTDPRIVPGGPAPRQGHLRGDARARVPRLEGAADPFGRIRRQVPGEAARALVLHRRGIPGHGHAHHLRGRRHGTGHHLGHRLQPRRGEDQRPRRPDKPGIAFAILDPIARANIDVDMIIQNASTEGLTDFSFTVHRNEYKRAMQILENTVKPAINAKGVVGDDRIAKVSLVGIGMRTHAGIASKMFGALAQEGVNIQMISTSEIKTSVVVDEKYMELAVRVLHRTFELEKAPAKETMKP
jgi:aspartate kinase